VRFLSEVHECYWFGLDCEIDENLPVDSEADLTVVEIPANNLAGDLPDEIYSLYRLQILTMDGNSVTGTISTLIGNLPELIFFDMDNNDMEGAFPEELYSLTKLQALDMNSNRFTGGLSPSIKNLQELVVIQLENNLLTGNVPTGGLLQLEKLGKCRDMPCRVSSLSASECDLTCFFSFQPQQ